MREDQGGQAGRWRGVGRGGMEGGETEERVQHYDDTKQNQFTRPAADSDCYLFV